VAIVPGRGGVAPVLWSLDTRLLPPDISLREVSVVGGHFAWDVWKQLPAITTSHQSAAVRVSSGGQPVAVSIKPLSCFVMHRHPVARVISYYYQRVYSDKVEFFHRRLNEWPAEELRDVIRHIRHPAQLLNGSHVLSDEGISNAACRALSGTRITTGLLYHADIVIPSGPDINDDAIDSAIRNSGQCVAGIQEDMKNTMRVLRFWFPWMQISSATNTSANIKNQGHYNDIAESIYELRSDIRAVIEDENRCDMKLYNAARLQFSRQLKMIDGKQYIAI
jgi:hypothetical protein